MKRLEAGMAAVALLSPGPAGLADFFDEQSKHTSVLIEDGRVETAAESMTDGISLRVHGGELTRFANLTCPSPADIARLASQMKNAGAPGGPVLFNELVKIGHGAAKPVDSLDLPAKVALCRLAEEAARKAHPSIVQVTVNYHDQLRLVGLATESGMVLEQLQSALFISVLAVAADGDNVQTGYESAGGSLGLELFEVEPVVELARRAALRAASLLTARRARGGVMPVVLAAEAGGTMVHEAVGHGLEADLVAQGQSIYKEMIGAPVAAETITVIDDPSLPGKRGSYAFDDEGVKSSPTVLIDKGILTGWLHSRQTAADEGGESTGNGRRESYLSPPLPRMSNTMIMPGSDDPAAIIKDTHSGLYVTRMGGGEVNTLTGEFVFEVAEGYLIENGVVCEPLRGLTMAGNGPEVLSTIDRVGSDQGFGVGTCGKDGQGAPVSDAQPTIRIPRILVGGEV